MILLDSSTTVDGTWHIIFEVFTVIGMVGTGSGIFFNMKSRQDVVDTKIQALEKHIEEIKVTATGLDSKLDTKMQRLEDKIDELPQNIAKIFNTLTNKNN